MEDNKNIMVCVTQQKTCERLIKSGHDEKREGDNLFIINVVSENDNFLYNSNDGAALEYLFEVSKKAGAELTVIRAKNVIKAISDFALKNDITHIVMGLSPNSADVDNNIHLVLKKMLPNARFIII